MESMERSSRSPIHGESPYSHPTPFDHIITYVPTPEDNEMLIVPQKLPNPVMSSQMHKNMQREMKINQKLGINVLGQKGELDRVFRDKKREDFGKQEEKKSDFQLMLEKRRKAQDEQEREGKTEEQAPEFLKIRNRLVKSDGAE